MTKTTTPKTITHTLDVTPFSAVMVCGRKGCQWRALTQTAPSAWRLLDAHLRLTHRDWKAAAYARDRALAPRA